MILKLFSFISLNLCWGFLTSRRIKKNALIVASGFSFVEIMWYKYWYNRYFTTLTQFVGNVYLLPFFIFQYRKLFNLKWRLLLMPINFWLYEIVLGYYLIFLFGYNPAWEYEGDFTLFSNNIRLDYMGYFWALGLLNEILIYFL